MPSDTPEVISERQALLKLSTVLMETIEYLRHITVAREDKAALEDMKREVRDLWSKL